MSKNNWTLDEITSIYKSPLLDLVFRAASIHRLSNNYHEVQISSLISIKTGGCPEDCSYCPQSARYQTGVEVHSLLKLEKVVDAALKAKAAGASRLCLGAAWREVRNNSDFNSVLEMVKEVNKMGMEVCCTLGMLSYEQAQRLKEVGLFAYNHNIDTSKEKYDSIISTRTFEDRLKTLENVRKANISVCCGGIIGLGETDEDRIKMLHTLSTMPNHPDSVPINALVPIQGTPLENQPKIASWELIRMIATARILMPSAVIRLSAGRTEMSLSDQALCFLAGANSIFSGDKLLTTPNPSFTDDMNMLNLFGLTPRKAFCENDNHHIA